MHTGMVLERDRAAEWRRYRLCGVMLVLMNVALAGVVVLVVHQNGSFHYAGYLIYAMALYTFYITIMAVVNLVRYRKYQQPGNVGGQGDQPGGGAGLDAVAGDGDAGAVWRRGSIFVN